MPNVAEAFIRGHQQGLSEVQQAREQEERDLRMALLKQQMGHEKIQNLWAEYQQRYGAAKNQAAETSGYPIASYPPSDTVASPTVGLPPINPQGQFDPSQQPPPIGLTPVPFQGSTELNLPGYAIPRQSLEQVSAQTFRSEIQKALATAHVLGPDASLVIPALNGGNPIATGGPKPKAFQQKQVLLNGHPAIVDYDPTSGKHYQNGVDLSGEKIEPVPPQGLFNTPEVLADITNNAQQLVLGNILPSTLSKRGPYNQILAEADRISMEQTGQHYNPVKLQLQYEAAKRFAGSMNSDRTVRFFALADSVVNTIDEARRLGDTLRQSDIQKWNQVKRGTIQQIYGNTPESQLAAQYVGAVNTLKEEFANLATGGYAPTDAAWRLANQQINENFGFKDLSASLTEIQRLINYRVNALREQRPNVTPFGLDVPPPLPGRGGAAPQPTPTPAPQPSSRSGFKVTVRP